MPYTSQDVFQQHITFSCLVCSQGQHQHLLQHRSPFVTRAHGLIGPYKGTMRQGPWAPLELMIPWAQGCALGLGQGFQGPGPFVSMGNPQEKQHPDKSTLWAVENAYLRPVVENWPNKLVEFWAHRRRPYARVLGPGSGPRTGWAPEGPGPSQAMGPGPGLRPSRVNCTRTSTHHPEHKTYKGQ